MGKGIFHLFMGLVERKGGFWVQDSPFEIKKSPFFKTFLHNIQWLARPDPDEIEYCSTFCLRV